MTPTANLRFVERDCYSRNGEHFLHPFKQRYLQQWWANDPDCYEDFVLKVNGEWRDIPLETEE